MKITSGKIEWVRSDNSHLYGFVQNKLMFVIRPPRGKEIASDAPFVLHDIPHDIAVGCRTVLDGCATALEDLATMLGKRLDSWIWRAQLPRLN